MTDEGGGRTIFESSRFITNGPIQGGSEEVKWLRTNSERDGYWRRESEGDMKMRNNNLSGPANNGLLATINIEWPILEIPEGTKCYLC